MKKRRRLFTRMLDRVEIIGNALPHPATIFALLAALVVVVSAITGAIGISAQRPHFINPYCYIRPEISLEEMNLVALSSWPAGSIL